MQKNKFEQVDIHDSKILIVDDHKSNIALLRNILGDLGYRLFFAFSGQEAFDLALDNPPDLMLLDMNMPGMDGVLTCEMFKNHEDLYRIPIIFVTSNKDVESLVRAFDVGASDFLAKPVRQQEIVARVRTHLLVNAFQNALTNANRKLENLAKTDQLTGAYNRRYFEERALLDWHHARRDKSFFGLLIIDIDYFKLYNDRYGHQGGDLALTVAAQAMQDTLRRSTDFVARYGGEEFVVVLPNTDLEGVLIVAERMLESVRELHMPHAGSPHNELSISIGAISGQVDEVLTLKHLVKLADEALYGAKEEGRDRVCTRSS